MKKADRTLADNDSFVTLIRLAQEDPNVRKSLVGILSQDPFTRKSLLNSMIQEMKMKSAPPEFIRAFAFLLDDGIAEQASELIEKWEGQQCD